MLFLKLKSISKFQKSLAFVLRTFQTTRVTHGSCSQLAHSPNAKLNKAILDRYMCLPIPECKVQAEYVWIDGTGEKVRSKSMTLNFVPSSYRECPNWNYDGNATYQPSSGISDIYLCPCAMYNDPIRRGYNKLVLCETYSADHKPTKTNNRASCVEALNCVCETEPMFAYEQEYQFLDVDLRPYGWPIMRGYPAPEGPYYCGVGANKAYGREIVEAHYRACLYCGISIAGVNAETMLSQWEFRIGNEVGIKMADDLWMARFLLRRIAEDYGVVVSFDPKIRKGWKSAGCHTKLSTREMRCDGGIKAIDRAICLLEKKHADHIKRYDPKGGRDNVRRLTGRHGTSNIEKFTSAVAKRNVSVRIPKGVSEAKRGFLEDRRPAANCDPYIVMDMLVRTVIFPDVKK